MNNLGNKCNYLKEWRKNKDENYWKEYYKKTKEWQQKNKEKYNSYFRKYSKNPKYRLDTSVRYAIWFALSRKKAERSWEKLVGYTLNDLCKYLENRFDDKMSWDNYGSYCY